jgi:Cu-Zn family superoxide dismutase
MCDIEKPLAIPLWRNLMKRYILPRNSSQPCPCRLDRSAPRSVRELVSVPAIPYHSSPMQTAGPPIRNVTRLAQAAAIVLALAACASDDSAKKQVPNIGARMTPLAGGVGHGLVTFRPYDGGLTVVAGVGGFSAGSYRIVVHTTPVCTSPNGFSAGPPFVPAGATAPVAIPIRMWEQGTATLTIRVPGIALAGPTGVEGKSLVLHASESGPLDAQPGVPNDRVACGVIGPIPTLF